MSISSLILKSKASYVKAFLYLEIIDNDLTYSPSYKLRTMKLAFEEIGGEKAISIIKENLATRHIPALLFSANADIREICKKINADGYIQKPFDVLTFKQIIVQYVPL